MSATLSPPEQTDEFLLRQTNVSNPSVIHSRPSQQSFTASEDYYSLSGSNSSTYSGVSAERAAANARTSQSQQTITRYQTPPSRYRTPQQSRDILPLPHPQQHAVAEQPEEEFRKTPMRGEGKRRQSLEEGPAGPAQSLMQQPAQLREGGIKRKPVPSTVMEQDRESRISPTAARSSVYRDIDRERDAPTPGVDDTPYIHFALDQLTRDEEVRGSRRYPGIAPGIDGNYPYVVPANVQQPLSDRQQRYSPVPQEERDIAEQGPYYDDQLDVPPPRNPKRDAKPLGPNVFVPVPMEESRQPPLNFIPGILRPLQLGLYMFLVLVYLVCLIFAAGWSVAHTGLWRYGSFGDGRYFVFQYLPTILGMIILMWLSEIQKALYRIAPFIAMASTSSVRSRIVGAKLPLSPRGFVLPYFGHFGAQQPIIGGVLFVAWLQIFTIPLLGSAFNAYQDNGTWSWLAVQGVIWVVVALYVLLLAALILLLVWLRRTPTGLKWDARSLADMIVVLERSNALDGQGESVPQLGYFHNTHRPNEVFYTYGVADKPARSYGVVDGQIREKRYSDPDMDVEAGQPARHSKDAMLPPNDSDESLNGRHGGALPWFLRPSLALLWPIIAIVLLLAFLIVSYLPSTAVANGFAPMLPPRVNTAGFSSTNFLYSFIPGLLATLCLLFWMNIDLAHRRLAPLASLTSIHPSGSFEEKSGAVDLTGDIAERTILASYTSDLPILVTLSALFNANYRIAFTSVITLLSTAIPILAGGVFWAQFYIPVQRVLISTDLPAYYALTVFLTIYALAYLAIFPPAELRHANLPSNFDSFAGVRDLLSQSRLLDDVVFRNPVSKTDLVTRLLSTAPGGALVLPVPAAAASKVSLADSVRGFGRARAAAAQPQHTDVGAASRFAYGRAHGRDGREFIGVDRVRK